MSKKKKRSLEVDLVDSLLAENDQDGNLNDVESDVEAENTVQLEDPQIPQTDHPVSDPETTSVFGHERTERVNTAELSVSVDENISFGRVVADKVVQNNNGPSLAMEVSLGQSENLRVAQNRILELEDELERVRRENEQLSAAGETLRRKSDDLIARAEKAELNLNEEKITFHEEKKIYKESLEDKDRENARLRERNEELELRLDSDLKKIRVRERELENRLELVKMEEAALLRNKDDIILDLKRTIDQLNSEVENYRGRSLELHKNMEADQERLRRTVRALRLALSMLEDGGSNVVPMRKAE